MVQLGSNVLLTSVNCCTKDYIGIGKSTLWLASAQSSIFFLISTQHHHAVSQFKGLPRFCCVLSRSYIGTIFQERSWSKQVWDSWGWEGTFWPLSIIMISPLPPVLTIPTSSCNHTIRLFPILVVGSGIQKALRVVGQAQGEGIETISVQRLHYWCKSSYSKRGNNF